MKMKRTQRILSIISILSLAVFANCGGGGGNETAPEKVQLGKLVKTWRLKSATASSTSATLMGSSAVAPDGQIETDFTLKISGTFNSDNPKGPYSFEVSGTTFPSPWQPSGKWFFGTNPKEQLLRDEDGNNAVSANDLGITYELNSSGELSLFFNCPDGGCQHDGSARVNSVSGNWIFVLIPQ